MNAPANKTVLAFMAHPDDAEMQCGGTLALLARLGWNVHIAAVASGDCGSAELAGPQIAAIRFKEGQAAARMVGGTFHCIGEPDTRVCFSPEAIQKAVDLFRRIAPSVVFTQPRHDYMMDHEQTHLIARAAAFAYPIPNASALPMKATSAVPRLYYCDPLEGNDPYTSEAVDPTVVVDISGVIEMKCRMLACHESQREWLRKHHGIDEYIEAMKRNSARRGELISASYGEAFVQHRGHGFPQDDILANLASAVK